MKKKELNNILKDDRIKITERGTFYSNAIDIIKLYKIKKMIKKLSKLK
jgi:hypothetical protein